MKRHQDHVLIAGEEERLLVSREGHDHASARRSHRGDSRGADLRKETGPGVGPAPEFEDSNPARSRVPGQCPPPRVVQERRGYRPGQRAGEDRERTVEE